MEDKADQDINKEMGSETGTNQGNIGAEDETDSHKSNLVSFLKEMRGKVIFLEKLESFDNESKILDENNSTLEITSLVAEIYKDRDKFLNNSLSHEDLIRLIAEKLTKALGG